MADREPADEQQPADAGEPADADPRLSRVTPGSMSPDDHAQHDRWLVVRATSGDDELGPAEVTSARALIDACSGCAMLAADIAAITHATAISLAPARPRDFRLTPAQASMANGNLWSRISEWMSGPRASVVRPLSTAVLAIGILLVAIGPSLRSPLTASDPGSGAPEAAPSTSITPDRSYTMEVQVASPPTDDGRSGYGVGTNADARMAGPDSTAGVQGDSATVQPNAMTGPVAKQTPEPQVAVAGAPGASPTPATGQAVSEERSNPSPDDLSLALTLLGIVLAGAGILVLLLMWLARRLAPDPLRPT